MSMGNIPFLFRGEAMSLVETRLQTKPEGLIISYYNGRLMVWLWGLDGCVQLFNGAIMIRLAAAILFVWCSVALAQENLNRFEVDEVTLQKIAAAIALDTNAEEPARIRDVIGLEDENVRLICGHALVINRSFLSAGYRPFNGTVSADGSFKLVNYDYPISSLDIKFFEQCERFGFRL